MSTAEGRLLPAHQVIIDRFVAACQDDERVVAAFLGGSYARGTSDGFSDLDLYLITTDEAHADFVAAREEFVHRLGEPLFLEGWSDYGFELLIFIFADGTEGELGLGRESAFQHIHGGPIRVLVDKKQVLTEAVFPLHTPGEAEQVERLRRLVYWFWHDVAHHFIVALGRGQLWSAYGALEDLRRTCVNLARLRHNFAVEAEGYEKVEQALPVEQLAPLQATVCALEQQALLDAARTVVGFYREVASTLAPAHGLPYPAELDRVMSARLAQLGTAQSSIAQGPASSVPPGSPDTPGSVPPAGRHP